MTARKGTGVNRERSRLFTPFHLDTWDDADFLAVSPQAKILYVLLISQRNLSGAGCIAFQPKQWARLAGPAVTEADVREWTDELVAHGFVLLDVDWDELLVRTYARHNMLDVPNKTKRMWVDWRGIRSARLKAALLETLPEDAFESRRNPPTSTELTRYGYAPDSPNNPLPNSSAKGLPTLFEPGSDGEDPDSASDCETAGQDADANGFANGFANTGTKTGTRTGTSLGGGVVVPFPSASGTADTGGRLTPPSEEADETEEHDSAEGSRRSPAEGSTRTRSATQLARDEVFEAVIDACRLERPRDGVWHKSIGSRIGKTVSVLCSFGEAPERDEVLRRADEYRTRYRNADLTLEALAKHWPSLAETSAAPPNPADRNVGDFAGQKTGEMSW